VRNNFPFWVGLANNLVGVHQTTLTTINDRFNVERSWRLKPTAAEGQYQGVAVAAVL
jgi:hypothetical protein